METIWREDVDGITYEYAYSKYSATGRVRVICYNTIMGEIYNDFSTPMTIREMFCKAMDQAKTKLNALREML